MRTIIDALSVRGFDLCMGVANTYADFFEPGRQGTGYEKLPLTENMFTSWNVHIFRSLCMNALAHLDLPKDAAHDAYMLRYRPGAFIPPHKDDAPLAHEHRRMNFIVQSAEKGGRLIVDNQPYLLSCRDAYIFRPDLEEHEVTKVEEGTRLVFTVGALR